MNTEKYWRNEFQALMNSREMIKYVVLSVEPVINTQSQRPSAKRRVSGADRKSRLAEVVVAREADLGVNDTQFTCVTHLGHILREGDTVLGYDLSIATWAKEDEASKILTKKRGHLPDVVLVRKSYASKGERGERGWHLRTLDTQKDASAQLNNREQSLAEGDYEEFLDQLEADREMRGHVNLYKTAKAGAGDGAATTRGGSRKMDADSSNSDGKGKDKANRKDGGVAADRRSNRALMEVNGDEDAGDSDDDSDDERLRLDELLDELELADDDTAAGQALVDEVRILSAEEAAAAAAYQMPQTSGFDPADFPDPGTFKFT
jgi:hypothetical protein